MPRLPPALLVALAPATAPATALPHEHLIWVTAIPDAGGTRRDAIPALLTLPAGWSVGDAAVVCLVSRGPADPSRGRLRAALLADGAAVLEIDPRRLAEAEGSPLAWLRGAFHALRRMQGAGLLVAIGFGPAGAAALNAARDSAADVPSAGVAPDLPRMTVVAGRQPLPDEGWPVRALLPCAMPASLCDATAPAAEAARECRDALVPLPHGRLVAG